MKPTIDADLMERLRLGLIRQMAADRLLGKSSEAGVAAALLCLVLEDKAEISIARTITQLNGSEARHEVSIHISLSIPLS